MIKIAPIIMIVLFTLTSCELFVIGSDAPTKTIVEVDQESPLGAVYLFKTELDSNNVPAAAQVLASPNGTTYLAIERYEWYFELSRLRRIIDNKPITRFVTDTISNNSLVVDVEFDYIDYVTFTTSKIDDGWYIVNFKDSLTRFIY